MPRDRRLKFKELAEKRVNKAVDDLRLIGNLSVRSNYAYTKEQTDKIVSELGKEIEKLKLRFENSGESEPPFVLEK